MTTHSGRIDMTVNFVQRGQAKRTTLRLQDDPRLEVVTYEAAGKTVTPEMAAFRAAWTGTQVR